MRVPSHRRGARTPHARVRGWGRGRQAIDCGRWPPRLCPTLSLSLLASTRVVRRRASARDATGPGASEKRAGKVKEGDGSRALVAPRLISAGGPPSLALATCIARVCTTRFLSDRCEPRETHRGPYLPTPEVVGRTMRARRGGGRVKKWGVIEKWCLARCQVAVAAPRRSRSPGPSTDTAGSRERSCACALKFSRHSDTNCVHTRRGHPRDPLDRLYFFGVHPPPRLPGSASKWARR